LSLSASRWIRHLRGWSINLVLILLIFTGVQWWKGRPLATGAAPSLVGLTQDGRTLDPAEFRGQPVLVHFWATWCPVCRLMDGAIDGIAQDQAVVTVALQSGTPDDIGRFMQEHGLHFPVISDPDGHLATRWGVLGVPATFVVDANGQIRLSTVGASTEWGLRVRLWISDQGN
jgi:peroxiredoxin